VTGQNTFSREELRDYLDEENRLTVRYVADMEEDYKYELLLPWPAVLGRNLP